VAAFVTKVMNIWVEHCSLRYEMSGYDISNGRIALILNGLLGPFDP
jgi:hypothetical protein